MLKFVIECQILLKEFSKHMKKEVKELQQEVEFLCCKFWDSTFFFSICLVPSILIGLLLVIAALNLLARHGDQLQTNLVSDFQDWHQVLQKWLPIGKEERAVSKQALLTFYYVLSTYISRNNRKVLLFFLHLHKSLYGISFNFSLPICFPLQDLLTFFSGHFKNQFETSTDIDIAVKGFGLFAKPIKVHLPEELPGIFNILSQRSQEECGK